MVEIVQPAFVKDLRAMSASDREAGVAVLLWPSDAHRRAELRELDVPRLLLVTAGAALPSEFDVLEDWVRMPVDAEEIAARAAVLARRAPSARQAAPVLDDLILRVKERWVSLSTGEAAVVRVLLHNFASVVRREELESEIYPEGRAAESSIRVRVQRVRKKIAGLGLVICTLRGNGYLLDFSAR